jgi:hypothetical protein
MIGSVVVPKARTSPFHHRLLGHGCDMGIEGMYGGAHPMILWNGRYCQMKMVVKPRLTTAMGAKFQIAYELWHQ